MSNRNSHSGGNSWVVQITAALIGAVAVIIAALITSGMWSPKSTPSPQVTSSQASPVVQTHVSNTQSPVSPTPPASTSGNWSDTVGNLQVTVTKVEFVKHIGAQKMLRFHLTVNNKTNDAIRLPLIQNFIAVDSSGKSYQPDQGTSNWPSQFVKGTTQTGTIELKDAVPLNVTIMSVHFAKIVGTLDLDMVGKSISITNIRIP